MVRSTASWLLVSVLFLLSSVPAAQAGRGSAQPIIAQLADGYTIAVGRVESISRIEPPDPDRSGDHQVVFRILHVEATSLDPAQPRLEPSQTIQLRISTGYGGLYEPWGDVPKEIEPGMLFPLVIRWDKEEGQPPAWQHAFGSGYLRPLSAGRGVLLMPDSLELVRRVASSPDVQQRVLLALQLAENEQAPLDARISALHYVGKVIWGSRDAIDAGVVTTRLYELARRTSTPPARPLNFMKLKAPPYEFVSALSIALLYADGDKWQQSAERAALLTANLSAWLISGFGRQDFWFAEGQHIANGLRQVAEHQPQALVEGTLPTLRELKSYNLYDLPTIIQSALQRAPTGNEEVANLLRGHFLRRAASGQDWDLQVVANSTIAGIRPEENMRPFIPDPALGPVLEERARLIKLAGGLDDARIEQRLSEAVATWKQWVEAGRPAGGLPPEAKTRP